jgi:hypothetical protein
VKLVIGILMCLGAIVFGIWAGVWWAFIGGIVDVFNEFKAVDTNALNIGIGVAKVFFCGIIGWLAFVILWLPGTYLVAKS